MGHFKLVHFNPMFFVAFDPSTLTAPSGVAGGVAKRGGGYKPLAVCPPHCLSTPPKKGVPAGFLQKFIKPYIPLFSDREMITLSFWPACLLKIQLHGREHLVLSLHQRGFGETPQPHTPPALGFSGPPPSCTTPSPGAETGPLLHNPVLPTRTILLGVMPGQCPSHWHAPVLSAILPGESV